MEYRASKDGREMHELIRTSFPIYITSRSKFSGQGSWPPEVIEGIGFKMGWPAKINGVLGKASAGDPSYSRLWLVEDPGGKLKEVPAQPGGGPEAGTTSFGPVKISSETGAGEVSVYFVLNHRKGTIEVVPEGYYAGHIAVGKSNVQLGIVDANYSGKLGDMSHSTGQEDFILLDLNGDGKFQPEESTASMFRPTSEVFPFVRWVTMPSGELVEFAVSQDGSLSIKPYTGPTGKIEGPKEPYLLFLESREGKARLRSNGGTVTAPAGQFSPRKGALALRGSQGGDWTVTVDFGLSEPPISIPENGTAAIAFGPPFSLHADSTPMPGECRIVTSVEDRDGRIVTDVRQPNGTRPTPPHMNVRAEGQPRSIGSMPFKYGCMFLCTNTWIPPSTVTGKFPAVVEFDLGPLGKLQTQLEVEVLPKAKGATGASSPGSAPTARRKGQ